MPNSLCRAWIGIALALPCCAQATKTSLTARDLYLGSVDNGKPTSSKAAIEKADTTAASPDLGRTHLETAALQRLGIRYKVLLFGGTSEPQPVQPKRVFKTGDCIALELHANLPGYLYILAEGASGAWTSLGPSTLVPDEISEARSGGSAKRAPTHGCIKFADPPGDERLFLFMSSNLADTEELVRLFKLSSLARMAPRDLTFSQLEQPGTPDKAPFTPSETALPGVLDEDPFTVYAVASGARLAVEVVLAHK